MPKKTFTPEQIVGKLRQIEVLIGQGRTVALGCREAEISEQTFYRWRKEYGGLQIEQARKLKDLEKENARLRRAVAELTVEKQVLKDIAEGNF
jgi:transposase-like protein